MKRIDAQSAAEIKDARSHPWRLLVLLMAMTAIGPMSLNILVPAVPGLIATFSTSAGAVQLTISLYLVGLAVAQLALGPLSDRFGRRPVVLAGLILATVASVLALLAATIEAIIVARVIQALGASTGIVIGRAIIRDLYDRDRAASMLGWVATAMVVAPMIAPSIGGVLDTRFGWAAIFLFIGAVSLLILIWTWVILPETRPDHITSGGVRFLIRESKILAASASFNGYVLASALGSATFFAFLGAAPHLVVGLMGRTSAEYGVWFIVTAFGYMGGNLTAARLSVRYGADRMIWAGLLLEIVGAILSVLSWMVLPNAEPEIIFIPQTLISFGNGVLLPNAIAGAISVRPQAAGTASGVMGFWQMGLGAVVAQVMGYWVAASNSGLSFGVSLLVMALAGTIAFALLIPAAHRARRRSA